MMKLRVIGLMFFALLLTACSKDGEAPEETQPVINIYVYSPEKPIITRGDVRNVAPIKNTISESTIRTLQIWVFKHGTGELVSYYSPDAVYNLNNGQGVTYQLDVSESFSMASPKPNVDVYIVANAESCGLSLGELTTRAALEGTVIKKIDEIDYFGLTSLTDRVPEKGLPMSGVLRDVAVTGTAPVFRISSVKLTRAVSKLRFIFSRDNVKEIQINHIYLGGERANNEKILTIPEEEYLFLPVDNTLYHVGNSYANSTTDFLSSSPLTDICTNIDPIKYTYQPGQNAQDYEDLIDAGLNKTVIVNDEEIRAPELTQVGPFYLRETDKKLEGTIHYQVEESRTETDEIIWATEKTASFSMKADGDFSRNHTWIVYAYYGVDGMQVVSVYSQNWAEVESESHDVHNW